MALRSPASAAPRRPRGGARRRCRSQPRQQFLDTGWLPRGSPGRWGLAESARLFALWHRCRAGECGQKALQQQLIPLQARFGRLLRRGQETPDGQAAGLCREWTQWWPPLWTFARVEGIEPTNSLAERALRPAVLWRKGSFGSDSEAGSRFAERLLTMVATCRQQGRPLVAFLVVVGESPLPGTGAPSLLSAGQGG